MDKLKTLDNKINEYLKNYGLSVGKSLSIESYIVLEELVKDVSLNKDDKRKSVEYYLKEVGGFRVENLSKLLSIENVTIEMESKMNKATKTFGIYIVFPETNVVASLKHPQGWKDLHIEEWKELLGFISESLYIKYIFSNPDVNEVLFDLIWIVQSKIEGSGSKERIEKEIIDVVFNALFDVTKRS